MEGKRRSVITADAAGKKAKRLKSSYSTGDRQCLFCWRDCKLEEEDEQFEVDNYPKMEGAVSSVLLRRNLCHWFIIRKLLDIPRYWCEAKLMTLPEAEEDKEEKNYGGPGSWFKVCEECLNTLVLEAWRVHDLILKLEGRMNDIKAKIRKKMRDNCVLGSEGKTGGESWRENEEIAMEIRKIVVPEMEELLQQNTVPVKVEEVEQHVLYPEEEDAILESVIAPELCSNPEKELPRTFDLIGPHSDDDDVNYKDDDPTDCNWTPPNGEDDDRMSNASINERAEIRETAVKNMRTRGRDKKKRKTVQNIRRGPYKKKIKDARKCLRTQRQLKVSKKEVSGDNENNGDSVGDLTEASSSSPRLQETKTKRKSGQRGKDKKKRKAKVLPRKREDRPKIILYRCDLCSCRPFTTSEELEAHKNLHEQRRLAKLVKVDTVSVENFDCEKCTFPAKDRMELDHHIRCRHDIPEAMAQQPKYPCPFCPKEMKNWMDMLHHINVKHTTANPEEVQIFKDRFLKCDECGFRGKRPRHLIMHKKRHQRQAAAGVPVREEDIRTCEECGQIFDNEKKYKLHVANTHRRVNRYVCDICGAGFLFPNKLNAHRVSHTQHLKRDYICHVCGLDFAKKQVLKQHSREIHPEMVDEDDPTLRRATNAGTTTSGTGEKIFSCRYCDLTSPYNAVIRKHLQTHKEQGKHECEKCGKLYINAQGLKRHLRINHNESGVRVPCPHCNREFPSQEYMMIHIKRYCKLKELH